jgi:hypothetical protein
LDSETIKSTTMKRIIIVFLFAIIATFGYSQDWVLEWYKSGNTNFLTREISQKVNQGYLPVGIEVAPDPSGQIVSLYVLYINDQSLGITAWEIELYNNDFALENGINAMGQLGYVPKEIAEYDGTYYVLFLQFQSAASAWTIQNATYSNQGLTSIINKYQAMGYVPFGYTLNKNLLNLLFVEIPLQSLTVWEVEVYNGLANTKSGITRKYRQGWTPWAIMIDGNQYIIMYLSN